MRQNDLAFEVRDYLKSHPNAAVVNLGGTIESLAPEVKDLTRTEMTELMEQIFSLSEVQRAVRHMTITHISQANREKELKADGTISSERHAD